MNERKAARRVGWRVFHNPHPDDTFGQGYLLISPVGGIACKGLETEEAAWAELPANWRVHQVDPPLQEVVILDEGGKPWPRRIEFGTPAQWAQWGQLYELIVEAGNGYGEMTIIFAGGRAVDVKLLLSPKCVEG